MLICIHYTLHLQIKKYVLWWYNVGSILTAFTTDAEVRVVLFIFAFALAAGGLSTKTRLSLIVWRRQGRDADFAED